jgi:hypothetical protein
LWKIDWIERSKLIRLLSGGSLENARGVYQRWRDTGRSSY